MHCARAARVAPLSLHLTHAHELVIIPLNLPRALLSDPCLSSDVSHVAGHLRRGRARRRHRRGGSSDSELVGFRRCSTSTSSSSSAVRPAEAARQLGWRPAEGQQAAQGGARAAGPVPPLAGLACPPRARLAAAGSSREGTSDRPCGRRVRERALSGPIGRPTVLGPTVAALHEPWLKARVVGELYTYRGGKCARAAGFQHGAAVDKPGKAGSQGWWRCHWHP